MGGSLTFEVWKKRLRENCVALEKLEAFDGLGEVVLRILYENGIDPTVDDVVKHGLNGNRAGRS